MAKKVVKQDEKRKILKANGWKRTDRGNEERWVPIKPYVGMPPLPVTLVAAWKRYLMEQEDGE